MTTKIFKGFSLVQKTTFEAADFNIDKDTLYFVRNGKDNLNDGFLYFNGKKYGTGVDAGASAKSEAIAAIKEYYGEELNGTHISAYIEGKLNTITSEATALTGRVSDLEGIVGKDADGVKTGLVKSVADNAAAIDSNKQAIVKLNGDVDTEGSVKKAVADAKTELIGAEETADTIKHAEKLAKEAATAVEAEKTRAEGIETELSAAVDKKVASVSGTKAIVINGDATAPEVSLKIAETQGNVVLSQDANGLKASIDLSSFGVKGVADGEKVIAVNGSGELSSKLSLKYDSTAKKIYLYGQDETVGNQISEIDATAFVKDGMLKKAELLTNPDDTHQGTFIVLTWNTDEADGAGKDKTPMYIDVTSLIDVYNPGEGLAYDAEKGKRTFVVDFTKVAKKADLDTVSGKTKDNEAAIAKLNGGTEVAGSVAKAVADAKAEVIGEGGTAKTIAAVEKALNDFTTQTEANAVTLVINDDDKYLSVTKAADENKYTVASKATEIDKSIKDAADAVKVSVVNGTYISGAVDTAGRKITLSETIQAVADASAEKMGLAEASDVKAYVDSKVSEKNVEATGDTLVSASAANNKVTIASTTKLSNAVTAAETAVQSAEGDTLVSASAADNKVTVSATEALTSAVAKANSAVQKVNGKEGNEVELKDSDIKIDTLAEAPATANTVNKVLADIYSKIGLVKVSSEHKTITVDSTGRIVDVHTEEVADAQAAGHVALEHGADGALYGVMYYSGDDVE